MEKIIKLEKEWQEANSLKAQLSWEHQLWVRDRSLGRNCEVELARATKRQEDLAQKLRMARVAYALLQCVHTGEVRLYHSEINEISDAFIESDDYQSLIDSLSPPARECLIDWVNIYGYPEGV